MAAKYISIAVIVAMAKASSFSHTDTLGSTDITLDIDIGDTTTTVNCHKKNHKISIH